MGQWPGCNHGTQILALRTGEGGEGQRSRRNLPHFAHLLPTTLARSPGGESGEASGPTCLALRRCSVLVSHVQKCFHPSTLSSLIYTPLLCTSLAHLSLFIRRGSQTPAGEGRTAVPHKGKAWESFPFETQLHFAL